MRSILKKLKLGFSIFTKYSKYSYLVDIMKNKGKIKIGDLSGKADKPEAKPLSDAETNQVVGGNGPWCRNGRPTTVSPW